MMGSGDTAAQAFAKTICSICYEDLKPIVEDLQAISICGHVFHELCLQQMFVESSKVKKKCPICKQTCLASNVSRLYFQSVGDSQKLQPHTEDPKELKLEVRRLEGEIKGLTSALESRESDLKNLNNELCVSKEQTHTINSLLYLKTQELMKSDLERIKLQERNVALAKELAVLKLVYDLDLKEDEIVKLAFLDEPHSKDSVDILTKCLVARNKLYIELVSKYKTLEREEACSRKELEKLKKKVKKMETAKEMKDNEVDPDLNDTCTPQDTIKESDVHLRETKRLRVSEKSNESNNKDGVRSYILIDVDAPKVSVSPKFSSNDSVQMNGQDKPLPNITKEASLPALNSKQAADFCFSAGLVGPGGSQRHLGKWCKKSQSKSFNASLMPTQTSGNFISVGAECKGGTIKVLKPQSLSSLGSLISAKSDKIGAEASSLQSRGSLRINHFFSKAGQS